MTYFSVDIDHCGVYLTTVQNSQADIVKPLLICCEFTTVQLVYEESLEFHLVCLLCVLCSRPTAAFFAEFLLNYAVM